jgi:hypothetical protein
VRGWLGLWDTCSYEDKLVMMLNRSAGSRNIKERMDELLGYLCHVWIGVFVLREALQRLQRFPLSKGLLRYTLGVNERNISSL